MNKSKITTLIAAFLVMGVLFFATPNKGEAGVMPLPPESGCCQLQIEETGGFLCSPSLGVCKIAPGLEFLGFFEGSTCNEQAGICSGFEKQARDVPTLSEWGLIAMAGVLGVVGFMVMRRRKVTA